MRKLTRLQRDQQRAVRGLFLLGYSRQLLAKLFNVKIDYVRKLTEAVNFAHLRDQ